MGATPAQGVLQNCVKGFISWEVNYERNKPEGLIRLTNNRRQQTVTELL